MASGDGGQSQKMTQEQSKATQRQSYSPVTQTEMFPKKEQAIVIEAKKGIPLKEYVFATGKIVKPTDIRFASHISNGRIFLFLASKQPVEDITSKYTHIKRNNEDHEIRPFINKSKRIILANVYPTIPHTHIEKTIDNLNIKRDSGVQLLRAGINQQEYSHIISFRRQVCIAPDDAKKLPDSIQINHEGQSS